MKIFILIAFIFLTYRFSLTQETEIIVQQGHTLGINCIDVSPDNLYLASGGDDRRIYIWEISMNKIIKVLIGHNRGINSVSYSPDGKYLACAGGDFISIWDMSTFKIERTIDVAGVKVKFSKNGKYLACCYSNKVKIWTVPDFKEYLEVDNGRSNYTYINTFDISSDEKYLAFGGEDSCVTIWNIESRGEYRKYFEYKFGVQNLAFSPTLSSLAILYANGTVLIWSWRYNDEKLGNIEIKSEPGRLREIKYDEKGDFLLFSCKEGVIGYFDIVNKTFPDALPFFNTINQGVKKFTVSKDYQYAFAIPDSTIETPFIMVNNFKTKTFEKLIYATKTSISLFDYNSSYKHIAINHDFGNVSNLLIWSLIEGKPIKQIETNTGVYSIEYSNNGQMLAVACTDSVIRIYKLPEYKLFKEIKDKEQPVKSISFHPNDKIIASSRSSILLPNLYGTEEVINYTKLWDIETGKDIQWIFGEGLISFSPDGKYLVNISRKSPGSFKDAFKYPGKFREFMEDAFKSYINVWEVKTNNKIFSYSIFSPCITSISFSPDSKHFAVTLFANNDSNVIAFKIENNKVSKTKKFSDDQDWYRVVGFTSDSKYLITGAEEGKIALYNTNNWNKDTLQGYNLGLLHVEVSKDNKFIFANMADGKLYIWEVETGKLISNITIFNTTNWIITTSDKYYFASLNSFENVIFRKGFETYPLEQFDLIYNRPDKVIEKFGYASNELIEAYSSAYIKRLKQFNIFEENVSEDFYAPVISILDKNIPFSTTDNQITLNLKATDSLYSLSRINVYINNVPIYGSGGIKLNGNKLHEYQHPINLELSKGNNKIQVSCFNNKGVESLKDEVNITCYKPKMEIKTYYVGIGVSNYRDKELNLKYAVKDVLGLDTLFKSKPNTETILLTNEQVTRENVLALKDKLMKTNVDDEVIISISGHGFLSKNYDFYFATYNINPKEPEINGVSYDEIENLLDGIPARKKLLLIDACHSGEVDKEETYKRKDDTTNRKMKGIELLQSESKLGLTNTFDLMQELFANLSRGSGVVVISASRGYQYAQEGDQWQNGVFTHCIIKGLKDKEADKNKNGEITVTELKDYVIEQVEKLTNGTQKPTSRRENLEYDWRVW